MSTFFIYIIALLIRDMELISYLRSNRIIVCVSMREILNSIVRFSCIFHIYKKCTYNIQIIRLYIESFIIVINCYIIDISHHQKKLIRVV